MIPTKATALVAFASMSTALMPTDARSAPKSCLTKAQADAAMAQVMPTVIASVTAGCAKVLPTDGYLMRTADTLQTKYRAEADRTATVGRPALLTMLELGDAGGLSDQTINSIIVDAVRGAIGTIKPRDCATAEEVAALADPLPAASAARILVLFMVAGSGDKSGGMFRICADGR